ncbi:MAG: hypothetical protein Q9174_006956, partial [Haloplaca sp. 1 TL-2023]
GKFADKNIPKELQRVIIAESGANDGLGYPFLFFALYLIKEVEHGGQGQPGGGAKAMGYWFGETWGYTILLSIVSGALVGWLAKNLLQWAEERKYVDRESFLVHALTLALFLVGTMGMLGSDDVLSCFIAGNAFTWDDWFRLETKDDSLQPTIDMLLNLSVFMWFGAVCPWPEFLHNNVVPIYRLIPLGILILLLRRLPIVYAMHWKIPQIHEKQQALFVGFFGPIGVSAIFYLYVAKETLRAIMVDGETRDDAAHLEEVIDVVVWFLAICSIVVHGLSVPLGKLGYHLPRTMSRTPSSMERDPEEPEPAEPFHIRDRVEHEGQVLHGRNQQRSRTGPLRPIFRIGGSVIGSNQPAAAAEVEVEKDQVAAVAASSDGEANEKVDESLGTGRKMGKENQKPVTVSEGSGATTAVDGDGNNGAKKTT